MDANLIVTYDPTHAGKAQEEIKDLLEQFGGAQFMESGFEGICLLHTKQDSKKIVRALTDTCREEPYKFKYTSRWIPIEAWCKSTMEEMTKAIKKVDERMKNDQSWKIDIGKRGYEGDTMDLVVKLTEHIDKPKVDLKNPDKIVKVEIVGDKAGVSLIDAGEYLNVARMKTA